MHIEWDPPGADVGVRQCARLFEAIGGLASRCDGWVVAGDFNASPVRALYANVSTAGVRDAYGGREEALTCHSSGVPKRIDYLFHGASLDAEP